MSNDLLQKAPSPWQNGALLSGCLNESCDKDGLLGDFLYL